MSFESDAAPEMKMITLKSSDGVMFEIEEVIAAESQMLKHMIEDGCADCPIPLPIVTSRILAKVIKYCRKHVEAAAKASGECAEVNYVADKNLEKFDAEFVDVDRGTLFALTNAANYLNIDSLLKLTCKTLADMIRGKTVDEIRKHFNIKNDFTREEEEELRRKYGWGFD